MAKKISQLESAVDVTASDLIQIVDVEDGDMAPSGTNKKATAQLLANELGKLTNVTATGSTTARSLANRFADVVNVKDFGAKGDGVTDDTAAIQAAINFCFSGLHSSLHFPRGRYKVTDTIRIDPALQGLTETVEAFSIRGEGSRNGSASTIRFDFENAAKNGFELISGFSINIENLQIDGIGAKKNLVLVDALDTPGFAGHLIQFKDVQFRNFNATPTEAVVNIKNSKLITLENCYVGTQVAGDTSILVGGNAADNTGKNLDGTATLCKIHNCYIWGIIDIKYAGELEITGNQFVEGASGIRCSGDGNLNNALISGNYFAENSLNFTPAIVLTAAPAPSNKVGSGSIIIERNRFRRKNKAIVVDGTGPVFIRSNSWELVTGANCGIEIAATAERIYVEDNYWDNLYTSSVPPVKDLRYTFGTSQPTANVGKSIVVDYTLVDDNNLISANNTLQTIIATPGINLSGGQYRVRCLVNVRCTDATKSLPFQVIVRYSTPGGDVNLGLIGNGVAPRTTDTYSDVTPQGTVYLERIVNLPANITGNGVFQILVRNTGSVTAATGFVEGSSTELTDNAATWIQVERLY